MSNYSATVVKIDNLRRHEGANRLQCTNVFGNNVIVGLDTKVGDIMLYFPLESQIGEQFDHYQRLKDILVPALRRLENDTRPVKREETYRQESIESAKRLGVI